MLDLTAALHVAAGVAALSMAIVLLIVHRALLRMESRSIKASLWIVAGGLILMAAHSFLDAAGSGGDWAQVTMIAGTLTLGAGLLPGTSPRTGRDAP